MFEGNGLAKSPAELSWANPQQHGTHIGYTTELEPILFDISQVTGLLSLENRYKKPDERNAFLLRDRDYGLCGEKILSINGQIEDLVGAVGPSLIKTFRTTINRYFPIVNETFFYAYDRRQKQNLDPTLLASVYVVAATALGDGIQASVQSSLNVDQLEELAFCLFEDSLSKPTLSTVQAGLLLIQSPNCDSNVLNAQLVSIAHELGFHLDCSLWKLADDETFLRKRLAWALFMQDKWCSLIHGRPSLIAKAHWAVQQLSETKFPVDPDASRSDGAAADEAKRGQELFTQLVDLTEILATVLDTFYTLQAMAEVDKADENGTRLILERAKPVQIRLKEWFTHLPLSLKMDNNSSGKISSTGSPFSLFSYIHELLSTDLNNSGHLHLAYFATEITLHRCIIRSLNATGSDSYLSHVCRSAAKTRLISAMEFVNRLQPEHLSSFWYFPSKVNFALIATFGSLLLATAPGQEEADFYRTRLMEYRWTLCVSSKSAEFLSFAVDSLDTSSLLLRSLPLKPSTSELHTTSGPGPGPGSTKPALAVVATASSHHKANTILSKEMPLSHGDGAAQLVLSGGLIAYAKDGALDHRQASSPSSTTSASSRSGSTTYDAYG